MSPELEGRIYARWPDWFDDRGDITKSLMGFGFQHGDGWYDLLVRTFERIAPDVATFNLELAKIGTRFTLLEVKEKFGELKIYAMPTTQAIHFAFLDACEQSRKICELCGKAGTIQEELCRTLCAECARRRAVSTEA